MFGSRGNIPIFLQCNCISFMTVVQFIQKIVKKASLELMLQSKKPQTNNKTQEIRKSHKSAIQISQHARKCDQLHTRVASALLHSHRQQAAHRDHTSSHSFSCSHCWNAARNQQHKIWLKQFFSVASLSTSKRTFVASWFWIAGHQQQCLQLFN